MEKIIVKQTCVIINDYNFGDCPKLENFFTLYEPTYHKKYIICIYYDNQSKRLYLPRGIDIWYLEQLFGVQAYIEKDMYTPFDYYTDIRTKLLPRNEDQYKALRFILGKGEYSATQTKSQLQLNLGTGKGKTYVAVGAIQATGIKSIVITYSTSVLLQWEDRILQYTNIDKKEILKVSNIGRLMSMTQQELYRYKIFLITHSLIKYYGDSVGWDKVEEFFAHIRVGIKIYDEAHQNFENMFKIDYFSKVYKTFYLTATPNRSNREENRVYQAAFKNVLSIELFHRDTDPHTHYVAVMYQSKAPASVISRCKNKYGLDRSKFTDYIITNENFLKMAAVMISHILTKIIKSPEQKLLIYIGTNNAISIFYQWMIEIFPFLRGNIGIFTSIVSDTDKQYALTRQVILTTTKSAGAAMDIDNLKCTFVLAEPFKSEVLAKQTLGRTRGENTYYIEAVDTSFVYCTRYFYSKKSIFNTYAKDTSVIKFQDVDLNDRYNNLLKISTPMPVGTSLIKPFTYDTSVKI